MNRRTALLTGAALLATGRASAHWIKDKNGRVYSVPDHTDLMCTHNRAHERGLDHDDNGNWFEKKTGRRAPETRESTDPEHEPTPQVVVDAMLAALKEEHGLQAGDTVLDPGCGDGRIVIAAARDYGCRCLGIEIDEERANQARELVKVAGVNDLVVIRSGDSRRDRLLAGATVVVMYLYADLIADLMPKFRSARVVASYQHQLPIKQSQIKWTMPKGQVFYTAKLK